MVMMCILVTCVMRSKVDLAKIQSDWKTSAQHLEMSTLESSEPWSCRAHLHDPRNAWGLHLWYPSSKLLPIRSWVRSSMNYIAVVFDIAMLRNCRIFSFQFQESTTCHARATICEKKNTSTHRLGYHLGPLSRSPALERSPRRKRPVQASFFCILCETEAWTPWRHSALRPCVAA